MTALEQFEKYQALFKATDLWKAMVAEVEGTEWHREANVGVHTDMLIEWYMKNRFESRTEAQRIYTLLACLFHDVAKPPSRVEKILEDGTVKRGYHGHERRSARMWINYAVENAIWTKLVLNFDIFDISHVAFMIEHHLPFAMKKENKRSELKTAFHSRGGEQLHTAWIDFLESDQYGRIGDKPPTVAEWIEEWNKVPLSNEFRIYNSYGETR